MLLKRLLWLSCLSTADAPEMFVSTIAHQLVSSSFCKASLCLCSDKKLTASISTNLLLWFLVVTVQKQTQQYRERQHEGGSERSLPQRRWAFVLRGVHIWYKGCCSTKLALSALGLCVSVWRGVHHGRGIHHSMPRTRCARGKLTMWLVAGGMTCMFCPSTYGFSKDWIREFLKTQQKHRYLSREGKDKGNFQSQWVLLLLKKKIK